MALLIVQKIVVFFLENLIAAIPQMIIYNAKKVQLTFETARAFIFREVQSSLTIKLNYVGEKFGVAIKEIFIPFIIEEGISSCASQQCI